MTPGELRCLSEAMNTWIGVPDAMVKDVGAMKALAARGLVWRSTGGWRNTEAGTRAYINAICEADGIAPPFANIVPLSKAS